MGNPKKSRGKCPPFYPNGWFRLCDSHEVKTGESKFFDYVGRHVVVYRGFDNIVYCMDAYCPHMGANLGLGGKVKHGNCIECPFHGWLFDGATGQAVVGKDKLPKTVS